MRAELPIAIDNRLPEGAEPFNGAVAETIVPNPFKVGYVVTASISLRDDPLAWMYARGGLEKWQFATGRRLQAAFEKSDAGRLQAFDPSAIHIKGSGDATFVKDANYDLLQSVKRITGRRDPKTGLSGYDVLRSVLSHGLSVRAVATNACVDRKVVARIFKNALNTAGEMLGFKGRAPNRKSKGKP